MVIVYKGGLEELTRQLEAKRPILDGVYEQVLGKENAKKVAEVAEKTLVPESFFDETHPHPFEAPGDKPVNQFNIHAFSIERDGLGLFAPQMVHVAPFFYVSARGFNPFSKIRQPETLLSSYVHAFNSFVWFALQNTPIYSLIFSAGTSRESRLLGITDILEEKIPVEEMANQLTVPLISNAAMKITGRVTTILDSLVLSSIGVKVDMQWRNRPSGYIAIHSPVHPNFVVALSDGEGDPFAGSNMGNSAIVRGFIKWQTFIEYLQHNFPKSAIVGGSKDQYRVVVNSLVENVQVSRVPITYFHAPSVS